MTEGEPQEPWRIAPLLGVDNVVKAVDYYVDRLGFSPPLRIYGSETEKVYAIVRRGGIEIHLQIRRSPDTRVRDPHDGDAYIFVPDVRALRDEFANQSVNITRELERNTYGLLDFSIETPFGHRLTFGSNLIETDVRPPREE